jgi:prepilin-type N-terminal cleavage/methylation domain-containing protein
MGQKGFSVVELLVAVVVLGVIGGTSWYVWSKYISTGKFGTSSAESTDTSSQAPKGETVKLDSFEINLLKGWTKQTAVSQDSQCYPGKSFQSVTVKKGSSLITVDSQNCGKNHDRDGSVYYTYDGNNVAIEPRSITYCTISEGNFCKRGDGKLDVLLDDKTLSEKSKRMTITFTVKGSEEPDKSILNDLFDELETIKVY